MQYVGYCHFDPKFTQEIMKLFEDNSDLADFIKHFNDTDEDKCVQIFEDVAKSMSENVSLCGKPSSTASICEKILNQVAFYPAKPSLFQEELVRLGLKETLSAKFSTIWAEHAKKIVVAKRRVRSDLNKVNFEVVRDVKSPEQSINLYLTTFSKETTCIKFTETCMKQLVLKM